MRASRLTPIWPIGVALFLIGGASRAVPDGGSRQPLGPGGPVDATQEPETVEGLLAQLSKLPGLYARYQEMKRIALLSEPLLSEGTIHYAPPRRLARHTQTPAAAHVVLDADVLRVNDGYATRQIDVNASPVVRALAESFLDVLAGDRAALERSFRLDFRPRVVPGRPSSWGLTLVPRTAALQSVLREITFEGEGVVVRTMRIREASGDESDTKFTDVDVSHHYSPEEAARVFRVDP